jgi:hypothetical protein
LSEHVDVVLHVVVAHLVGEATRDPTRDPIEDRQDVGAGGHRRERERELVVVIAEHAVGDEEMEVHVEVDQAARGESEARGAVPTYLGYTASDTIYLFGSRANGADIWIDSGRADLEAGLPGDVWPRTLAILHAGDSFHVTGLGNGEVLSAQSTQPFTYRVSLPPASDPSGDPPSGGPGEVMQASPSLWRCNVPECWSDDWTGAVIAWPSASAYTSNARPGNLSRSVFAWDDTPLTPYMGAWADGCEVTGESGIARVIEWQRGSGQWRDTWLYPGQTHVIRLVAPEDGALIEGYDASPGFSVSVRNCTPQPLPP